MALSLMAWLISWGVLSAGENEHFGERKWVNHEGEAQTLCSILHIVYILASLRKSRNKEETGKKSFREQTTVTE